MNEQKKGMNGIFQGLLLIFLFFIINNLPNHRELFKDELLGMDIYFKYPLSFLFGKRKYLHKIKNPLKNYNKTDFIYG